MKFEWNEIKAKTNLEKHGVSFNEASTVFFDDSAIDIDLQDVDGEERTLILGVSAAYKTLVVCCCYRDDDNVIRIISARRATKNETKTYWNE